MTICELRTAAGLSQSGFAAKFHLTKRAVQSWEQGFRNCPEHVLYMIERILEYEGILDKEMTDSGKESNT